MIKLRLPTQQEIENNRYLKWLSPLLRRSYLWVWKRSLVARSAAIGMFAAWMPIPFQLWLSVFLAIYLRANLPVAMALIWLSNPITFAPMIYCCYWVGIKILKQPPITLHFSFTWDWFVTEAAHVWQPLFLGATICGLISALIAYLLVIGCWKFFSRKTQEKLQKPNNS